MQELDSIEWVTTSWVVKQFPDSFSNTNVVHAFVNLGKIRSKKIKNVVHVPIEDAAQCDQFLRELKSNVSVK